MPTRARWSPPTLSATDVRLLVWVAVAQATVRGIDYLTLRTPGGRVTEVIEEAIPFPWWGTFFLIGAFFLAVGMLRDCQLTRWLGHWISAAAYCSLAVGIIVPALGRPWADGIRSGTVLALITVLHVLMALRTGMPRGRHAHDAA